MTPDDQLSADELAALSETLQAAGRSARSSSEVRAEAPPLVLRYDLAGASTTAHYDLPALDLVQEQFALTLSKLLTKATRQEGSFVPHAPAVVNFSEVYASLAMPCGVVVVEVTGLGCTGLLLIEPALLLHLAVDLALGGPGGLTDTVDLLATRGFSQVERSRTKAIVKILEKALVAAWEEITPIGVRVVRIEADPRHSAVFLPGDRVCDFRLDVEWGEVSGDIRFVVPMEALRPFERRLSRVTVTPEQEPDDVWRAAMAVELRDVPVDVVAVLGQAKLSLARLLSMEPGDVMRLDQGPGGHVDVLVGGVTKYQGAPRVHNGDMAVELTELLAPPAAPIAKDEDQAATQAPDDDDDDDDDDAESGGQDHGG